MNYWLLKNKPKSNFAFLAQYNAYDLFFQSFSLTLGVAYNERKHTIHTTLQYTTDMYIKQDIEKLQMPKVFLDKPSQRLPINTYQLRTCIAIHKADSYIYKGDSYNILI